MAIWDTFFNNQPSTNQVGMAYDNLAKMYKDMSERDNPILKTIADFNTNLQKGIIDVNNQKVLERLLSINDQDRIDRLNQGKNTWEGYGISPTGGMLYNPKDAAIVAARQKADSDLQNFFGSYITSNAPGTLEDYQAESTDDMLSRLGFTNVTPEQKLQAEKKRVANIQNELLGDTSGNTLNRVASGDLNPLDVNQKSFIDDFNQYAQSQGVNPNFISEEAKNKEWSDLNGRLRNPENYEKYITGITNRNTRKYVSTAANAKDKFMQTNDFEKYFKTMSELNKNITNVNKDAKVDINTDNEVLNRLSASGLDQIINNDNSGGLAKELEDSRSIVENALGQIQNTIRDLGKKGSKTLNLESYADQIQKAQKGLNDAWTKIENEVKIKYGDKLNAVALETVMKAIREQFVARTSDIQQGISDYYYHKDLNLLGGTEIEGDVMTPEEMGLAGSARAITRDFTSFETINADNKDQVKKVVDSAFVKADGKKDDEGTRINPADITRNLQNMFYNDPDLRKLTGNDRIKVNKAVNWALRFINSDTLSTEDKRKILKQLQENKSLDSIPNGVKINIGEGKAFGMGYLRHFIKSALMFYDANRATDINNHTINPLQKEEYNKLMSSEPKK